MDEIPKLKQDQTKHRWLTAIKDKAFDSIRNLVVLETQAEHFLKVLENGSVSTNIYLRRIHNFALDMNWLPWPVLATVLSRVRRLSCFRVTSSSRKKMPLLLWNNRYRFFIRSSMVS